MHKLGINLIGRRGLSSVFGDTNATLIDGCINSVVLWHSGVKGLDHLDTKLTAILQPAADVVSTRTK